MTVEHISFGPPVNESERMAIERLKLELRRTEGLWVILSNLPFSLDNNGLSEDIDLMLIGPPGVSVVEVKHWDPRRLNDQDPTQANEGDKIQAKARKVAGKIRLAGIDAGYVPAEFLLTREGGATFQNGQRRKLRGVPTFAMKEWKELARVGDPRVFGDDQVRQCAKAVEPLCRAVLGGDIRRLGGYINLERATPEEERFHRVYRGRHSRRQDKILLHLYDLSAKSEGTEAVERLARREFEALIQLQHFLFVPRVLDSFQDLPSYPNEMAFFTLVDPAAPTLRERSTDEKWDFRSRLQFAVNALECLERLHTPTDLLRAEVIHRNLHPGTILVRSDNSPLFTGFEAARVPADGSVSAHLELSSILKQYASPEVLTRGLGFAGTSSDVYSICKSLAELFYQDQESKTKAVSEVLVEGCAQNSDQRPSAGAVAAELRKVEDGAPAPLPVVSCRYWSEDQNIRFEGRTYRILTRLGNGSIGYTYKVVEVDEATKEEGGTFVAKAIPHEADGKRCLSAYRLAQPHVRHSSLSGLLGVAKEWSEIEPVALLHWLEGTPLQDITGCLDVYSAESTSDPWQIVLENWLRSLGSALDILHRNGLIHGDVSPRNIIVLGDEVALTDYDFVTRIGEPASGPGTVAYCSPEREDGCPTSPADDFFALAAVLFHLLTDKLPFDGCTAAGKRRGLILSGEEYADLKPAVRTFLLAATAPDATKRPTSWKHHIKQMKETEATSLEQTAPAAGTEVAARVELTDRAEPLVVPSRSSEDPARQVDLGEQYDIPRSPQRVEWLESLLEGYSGSPRGNADTRGIDSDFARITYVPTLLEESILRGLKERKVRLIILCGNAGDGKTALLQHLLQELGLAIPYSSQRIVEKELPDGLQLRLNLDGSAGWKGKSADELLDQFFEPMHQLDVKEDVAQLLAINDGRLLEWLETATETRGETPLIRELRSLLMGDAPSNSSFIRFISLNNRSLVGGLRDQGVSTEFLDRLIDRLYGGNECEDIWGPCSVCVATDYCPVNAARLRFSPNAKDKAQARQQLFIALQAVHQRGEVHVTARELRGALTYILFGTQGCKEIIESRDDQVPYFERAFNAGAPYRQGEVLRELALLDPALEAHPAIDRYLQCRALPEESDSAPRYPELTNNLPAARRRAWFEWVEADVRRVARDQAPAEALPLAKGKHLHEFASLPLMNEVQRRSLTARLCKGISRLEDLPPKALSRPAWVPLQVIPRTPTETAFWVEKELDRFTVEADLPPAAEGLERLHRYALLTYRFKDDRRETLRMGSELFHLLLDLADGYQLGDTSTDDIFSNLSLFVQRLSQEDARRLLAWSPLDEERIHQIAVEKRDGKQVMVLSALDGGSPDAPE